MTSAYKKYTDDQMKYVVQSTNKHNAFQYVMDNPAGEFFDWWRWYKRN